MDINIAEAFCAAMERTELGVTELAEASGRSVNNISEIKLGKTSPNIESFGRILAQAESLRPGFVREFCRQLLGGDVLIYFSAADGVANMTAEQKAEILFAIAANLQSEEKVNDKLSPIGG